ncbi:MAG TPA: hypothetical protein VN258_06315 [Mobilitalea sp.]|nr:hypothetical protein [Mobilitalea sp.]
MVSEQTKNLIAKLKQSDLTKFDNLNLLFEICLNILSEDQELALKTAKFVKHHAALTASNPKFFELYNRSLLFLAPYYLDEYILYMEKDRAPEKRFYLPRRKVLKTVVDDLQDLEDREIDFYGLSLPPRVGKSTICIFFLSWVIGKRPNSHNAMGGHSGILAKGFYGELLTLINSPDYHFAEIFPTSKLESKSADEFTVNLDKPDRFASFTARGIDGTWTGAIDISKDGYLYVDDLVRDRTESLSPVRLNNRYQDYLNVMVDRKNDGSRELMVGTRWSIQDPLGKIEEEKKNNPRYRFRKIPALNEKNESNFQYDYGVGFSTKYFLDVKERLDNNEWMAKYQQKPFIREGLLFPEDELKTYNGVLPEVGLVRKIAVCDVAFGGGDSLSMPFAYEYEDGKVYLPDWIFNRGDKKITVPIVAGKTLYHKPSQEHFEANNGGDMYANLVDEELKKVGFKTNISSSKAPNTISKMAKIIQYAPDIKERFYFLDEQHRSGEYQEGFEELTITVQVGKNEHDDAADSMAQLAAFLDGGFSVKTTIIDRSQLGI